MTETILKTGVEKLQFKYKLKVYLKKIIKLSNYYKYFNYYYHNYVITITDNINQNININKIAH